MKVKQIFKKGGQYLVLLSMVFLISACGGNTDSMDKKGEDGKFHYGNQALGFQLKLPSTFKKYQTQRKEGDGFTEVQILVPTADRDKFQEVRGYAQPVTVRIYDSPQDNYGDFQEIASGSKGTYTLKFWRQDQVPDDWKNKWNDQVKTNIRNSFQVNSD